MTKFRWILTGIGLISVIIAVISAIITLKAPLEPSVAQTSPKQSVRATQEAQTAQKPPSTGLTVEGILTLINDYRIQNGHQPLVMISELTNSAMEKCLDMLDPTPDANGAHYPYFDHVNPTTGVHGVDIAKRAYPNATKWGENLASGVYATNQQPFDAWVNSSSHRGNILTNYRVTGIAICPDDPSPYLSRDFVQHFAR